MLTFPRTVALAAAALLAASCAGSQVEDGYTQEAPMTAPTVEQLAAKVGCTPKMQVDATDLRTGHCATEDGEFFVNTFATQTGKDDWMDQAPEYNPHLVGHIWTVLGEREVLEALRVRLGGDLHLKDHRVGPTP